MVQSFHDVCISQHLQSCHQLCCVNMLP
uniref:Uncharacterized protein n=1 Tax=Arundo donax TaxID=35708 RepID=A0A0A8YZS1_ARUDO